MIDCDAVGWVVVLLVGGCGSVGREASKELHNCTFAFIICASAKPVFVLES
jgi:hypothetical protein